MAPEQFTIQQSNHGGLLVTHVKAQEKVFIAFFGGKKFHFNHPGRIMVRLVGSDLMVLV